MKTATASAGRSLISFAIPDNSALRGHAVTLVISIGGVKVHDYVGSFPPANGLAVALERRIDATATVVADTSIDGVAIAAARDGTLTLTAR